MKHDTYTTRRFLTVTAIPLTLILPSTALAGKLSQANASQPVNVEIDVHLALAPTQQQLDDLEEKLEDAAMMICDATDGAVWITDFWVENNGYSAAHSDMIIMPDNVFGESNVNGGVPFTYPGRVLYTSMSQQPGNWGHEFGHLVLGLKDQYDGQHNFGCGQGPSIDVLTEEDNTIMATYYSYCHDPNANNDTAYDVPSDRTDLCRTDADCSGPTYTECGSTVPNYSELSVANNFELELGTSSYPGSRSGERLFFDVRLSDQLDIAYDDTEDFVSVDFVETWASGPDVHTIKFRARQVLPGQFRVKAEMADGLYTPQWLDGVTVEPELLVTFDGSCDLDTVFGDSYPGSSNPVKLVIPGGALEENGASDVELEVDLADLICTSFTDLIAATSPGFDYRDTPDGEGTGFYIGAPSGTLQSSSVEPVYQQLGLCDKSVSEGWDAGESWNEETQRWEGSKQWKLLKTLFRPDPGCGVNDAGTLGCPCDTGTCSGTFECLHDLCVDPGCNLGDDNCGLHLLETGADWELLRYNLEYAYPAYTPDVGIIDDFPEDLDLSGFVPPNWPEPDPDVSGCNLLEAAVDVHHNFEAFDSVAMVIDYSGSMEDSWNPASDPKSRFEWAKRALVKYATEADENNDVTDIAVIKFNGAADTLVSYRTLDAGAVGAITTALDDLDPVGSTAIGDGILKALEVLPAETGGLVNYNHGIFLLTDGAQNTGSPLCDAIENAATDGVPVYIAPIGTFDGSGFACVPDAGGKLLGAVYDDETPAAMFEMRADFASQQLSLAYERSAIAHSLGGYSATKIYTIEVEPGAEALTLQITPSAESRDTWELGFELTGPAAELITEASGTYVDTDADNYYYGIRIPNPSAGEWTLELQAPHTPGAPAKGIPEVQTVMARVEHEGPRCMATPSAVVVTSTSKPVEIHATTSWDFPIGEGASFSAEVRTPGGTEISVPMTVNDEGEAIGSFDSFSTDGIYLVSVNCVVDDNARYLPGEGDDGAMPSPGTVTDGFERVHLSTFIVDAGLFPTPAGDCDDNGIADSFEGGSSDADGDGWPNHCDDDNDDDDVPDSLEGTVDTDGDGVDNLLDIDADNDGDHDSVDWDHQDALSYLLHAVGDFNGDGKQDQLWGEPEYNSGRGRIMVEYAGDVTPDAWHRSTTGILGVAAVDDNFGATVVAGDFDDDGYDDVAIGVPGGDHSGLTESGEVHIIYGSTTGLTASGDQLWNTDSAGMYGIAESDEYFGSRLSVGDFNCDGYADLIVGVPDEAIGAVVDAGMLHAIYGSSGGLTSTGNDYYYQGFSGANGTTETGDRFGDTFAVGDFDNDTCSDLVVGVPGQDSGMNNAVGEAYVMYGVSTTGVSSTGDWTIIQGTVQGTAQANERFSTRLWADDLDANGYDDLVIMTPGDCTATSKGFNYVYGGASGLSTSGNTHSCQETLQ